MTELDPNVCPLVRWQKHLRAIPPPFPPAELLPPGLRNVPARISGPARVTIATALVHHGWRWPGITAPRGRYAIAPAEVPRVRTLVDAAVRHHAGTPVDERHRQN